MNFHALLLVAFAEGSAESGWIQLLPIPIIFAIFYFLLLAPMKKRQKQLQKMVETLKKGDKVVTNGGIFGEVAAIEGSIVHLKIADSVRIRVLKSAIAGPEGAPEQEVGK
jgi:preprotein translocase subunit YajC